MEPPQPPAYDMAKFGDADAEAALRAARRVNTLLGQEIARGVQVDVTREEELVELLQGIDSFLSAVPYWLNPGIARAAIKGRASMCDLGGNTPLVFEQLKLDPKAREAGISIISDCGQVPGMGNPWQPMS